MNITTLRSKYRMLIGKRNCEGVMASVELYYGYLDGIYPHFGNRFHT